MFIRARSRGTVVSHQGWCVDAGGMHGGLTVGRLARESLCSDIAIIVIISD
jgi:hypothetical protein